MTELYLIAALAATGRAGDELTFRAESELYSLSRSGRGHNYQSTSSAVWLYSSDKPKFRQRVQWDGMGGEVLGEAASKLKGRVSKWLRTRLRLAEPLHLLSRGYFACTVGQSKTTLIEQYLETQGAHHRYDKRLLPPIFVEKYELSGADEARLTAEHAYVVAQFHVVLATCQRRGIFGSVECRKIACEWRKLQAQLRIAIIKVSFVPDHVHIALRMHPAVSPADIVAALMNAAQDTVRDALIPAGLDRLWEPSAYVGSYGDLASPQIRKYIENLRRGS